MEAPQQIAGGGTCDPGVCQVVLGLHTTLAKGRRLGFPAVHQQLQIKYWCGGGLLYLWTPAAAAPAAAAAAAPTKHCPFRPRQHSLSLREARPSVCSRSQAAPDHLRPTLPDQRLHPVPVILLSDQPRKVAWLVHDSCQVLVRISAPHQQQRGAFCCCGAVCRPIQLTQLTLVKPLQTNQAGRRLAACQVS